MRPSLHTVFYFSAAGAVGLGAYHLLSNDQPAKQTTPPETPASSELGSPAGGSPILTPKIIPESATMTNSDTPQEMMSYSAFQDLYQRLQTIPLNVTSAIAKFLNTYGKEETFGGIRQEFKDILLHQRQAKSTEWLDRLIEAMKLSTTEWVDVSELSVRFKDVTEHPTFYSEDTKNVVNNALDRIGPIKPDVNLATYLCLEGNYNVVEQNENYYISYPITPKWKLSDKASAMLKELDNDKALQTWINAVKAKGFSRQTGWSDKHGIQLLKEQAALISCQKFQCDAFVVRRAKNLARDVISFYFTDELPTEHH